MATTKKNVLAEIQSKLKVPKEQRNNFGGFNYRSAEDILDKAKPILLEYGLSVIMSDDVKEIGGRIYVKSTVSVGDGSEVLGVSSAYAREAETKKGMDEAQITGSASSYARKYALCGLFAIDAGGDPDAVEQSPNQQAYANHRAESGPVVLSNAEAEEILRLHNLLDEETAHRFIKWVGDVAGVSEIRLIPKDKFSVIKGFLEKKLEVASA